jgi:SAM-dependent methyltransferase
VGSSQVQGDLWGARAREWADLQESSFRGLYDAAFDAAGLGPGSALLDVGCGAGLALRMAQDRGARVAGLDAAAGLAAIAGSRCPGAVIRVGDIEELPFGADEFDVTAGFNSFQFAADPVRALGEAKRVTRPSGHVVVAVWGAAQNCELAPYIAALGKLLPPPPPNAEGPFALSAAGALEALVGNAGLSPERVTTVTTVMSFTDEPTPFAVCSRPASPSARMRHSGEEAVARGVSEAISPFRQADGSYRFSNEWRFLVSRA